MPPIRDNPPKGFVDLLERNYDKLPTPKGAKLASTSPVELGCGRNGCVYKTTNPDIVLKLTLDADEAAFAQYAALLNRFPPGIVKYHKVVRLGKLRDEEHYRRSSRGRKSGLYLSEDDTVYALWRDSATQVGNTANSDILNEYGYAASPNIQSKDIIDFRHHKALYSKRMDIASTLSNICKGKHYKSKLLESLSVISAMLHIPPNQHVAEALLYYLSHGVWIRDIHSNNVGYVSRAGKRTVAIIDPGAAHFLVKRPAIPKL